MVVAISPHRIAYMAVPKAACTSVKAALARIDPDVTTHFSDLSEDSYSVHRIYPTRRFSRERWQRYQGWHRFTVVRDPLQRLLSVYSDLVIGRHLLFHSPRIRQQTDLPANPNPDFFFQNLKAYRKISSAVRHHTMPVRYFAGANLKAFDRVYRTEELPELCETLTTLTGAAFDMPRLNRSPRKLEFSTLEPRTQDQIAALVKNEYEDLQGYYTDPF